MAAKPKPKADDSELPRLFTALQLAGEDGDYDTGLEVVEKILSLAPQDGDALHCKLVCLVQLSRFHDAITLIDALNKKGEKAPHFQFEKAYCLYRLEKYTESRRILQKLNQVDRVKELSAQISYRLESYDEARTVYESMIRECSDDFSNEREANYAAALSLCSEKPDVSHVQTLRTETMEQSFNAACCYISLGHGDRAEAILVRAEEQCRKSLQEEDLTDEEMESELIVIRLQLGFAKQLQHQSKEALGLYVGVLKQKPSDVSHAVIASNNIIVLNRDRDIFDSKKKVKVLVNKGNSKKLMRSQKLLVLYNRCLFALQTNQLEQCREMVAELKRTHGQTDLATLVEATLLHRERKTSACIELLETHLRNNPHSSLLLHTSLAQLLLSQGNVRKACSALRSVPDVSQHVGIISTLVSLYSSAGEVGSAVEVLDEVVSWWTNQPQSEPTQRMCRSLMLENAQYKLQHGKPDAAAAILEKVRSHYTSDLSIQAMLISAYSRFDPRRAEEVSRSLPRVEDTSRVDVDTLEQMPSFRHTRRQLQKPETADKLAETKGFVPKGKKKKRKPKLPKNYDPSVAPDPERWHPLKERSYYRRGRKKGFFAIRGTQGSSVASAALTAQLDASKPKAAVPDTSGKAKSSEPTSPKAKPQQHPKKKQPQKKKKKGGKW